MIIRVTAAYAPPAAKNTAYLIQDNWDDWGKYRTMFTLVVYDATGEKYDPGLVKIGQFGLAPASTVAAGHRAPSLPQEFESLPEGYFSLGQNDDYYETLNLLPPDVKVAILQSLRDCAYDLSIFERAKNEVVMQESLLRSVADASVHHRFHRLAHGNAALTAFDFDYILPTANRSPPPPILSFRVSPQSEPPTNVHVLIGRNGVGKTSCIRSLAAAVVTERSDPGTLGVINSAALMANEWAFAGLIVVAFSAFDTFEIPRVSRQSLKATFVGLKTRTDDGPMGFEDAAEDNFTPGDGEEIDVDPSDYEQPPDYGQPPDYDEPESDGSPTDSESQRNFPREFALSLGKCRIGPRRDRCIAALSTLENDPLFADATIKDLLDLPDFEWRSAAQTRFESLSSGHKIVLLTIMRLVELVDERTLVLMDEPEGHLHPPLLSAFIRAVSDLLFKRNGVAIVATHSPVVLQEVPRSCAWVLRRSGSVCVAERPSIETFGENVGTLTREVFGLEVTTTGFHERLQRAAAVDGATFDTVLANFDGQLGAEARAIVQSLIAIRARSGRLP